MPTIHPVHSAAPGLAAVLLALGAACGSRGATAAGSDSVYVGLAVHDAPDPSSYRQGAALALAVLNAARAPEDMPLALREAPPSATTAAAVAEALRDDPDLVGVVGHARDATTREAARVYAARRPIVAVSPTALDEATAAMSEWVFRVSPAGAAIAAAIAQYATDSLGLASAAVIYPNDHTGRAFARAFARAFDESGGTVAERDPYLTGDASPFRAYAPRIAVSDVGVVVAAGAVGDLVALEATLDAVGFAGPLVVVPSAGEGFAFAADTVGTPPRIAAAFDGERRQSRAAAEFVAAYVARYQTPPDARAALAYDATMLIGLAVREVGVHRRAVRDWIARTGRGRPAHQGAAGPVVFDGSGNPVNKPVVMVAPTP